MIPQNQTWSTGGISFYINGTADQLWPTILTASHIGGSNCNTSEATSNPCCAAGGFNPLYNHYDIFNTNPLSDFTFTIADSLTMRTLQGDIRNSWESGGQTWTQSPHVATAVIEEPLRQAWSSALRRVWANFPLGDTAFGNITSDPRSSHYVYADIRTAQVQTQFPVVRTVCVPSENLTADNVMLPFPVLPEFDFWYWNSETGIGTGAYGNGVILSYALPEPLSSFWETADAASISLKSTWVVLPAEFGSATAGLALLFPPTNATQGKAISCTIDARWTQGQQWVTSSATDWDGGISLAPMQSTISDTSLPIVEGRIYAPRLFAPSNDSNWRRIFATPEYLNALTPPMSNVTNTTTLEFILIRNIPKITSTWYPDISPFLNSSSTLIPFVEHIISTLVVDGIARTGSSLQQSPDITLKSLTIYPASLIGITQPPVELEVNSTTPMRMDTSVEGYALVLSGFTSYFAAAILLLHVIIALIHTAWMLWTRRTSNAWESIPELLVLAQESTPAGGPLENTDAGISATATFAATARIIETSSTDDAGHLELVWTDLYGQVNRTTSTEENALTEEKVIAGKAY